MSEWNAEWITAAGTNAWTHRMTTVWDAAAGSASSRLVRPKANRGRGVDYSADDADDSIASYIQGRGEDTISCMSLLRT